MYVIQTKGLTKSFKKFTSLKNINLTIEEGEICAIIGKNGAGKSTLFQLIANRCFPTKSSVQLFEKSSTEQAQILPKISFMIEKPGFFDDFTAKQNLEYFRLQEGVTSKKRIEETLGIVGLKNAGKKKYREFSLGMKQRLGIGLALLSNPDCIVLDEPTNGLDAQGIIEIRQLLRELNQNYNVTVVISSHILSELQLLASRFVFLNNGEIIEELTQVELQNKAAKKLVLVVNEPSKAAQVLERNFPEIDYQVLLDKSFEIFNYFEERDQINLLLVNEQVKVSEMRLEEGRLEDYFLTLIGGQTND